MKRDAATQAPDRIDRVESHRPAPRLAVTFATTGKDVSAALVELWRRMLDKYPAPDQG